MLRRAADELKLHLARSFVIGDRWHDLQAGDAVGARGILVRTGYGRTEEAAPKARLAPVAIVDNLIEAASWILRAACCHPPTARACWRSSTRCRDAAWRWPATSLPTNSSKARSPACRAQRRLCF